MAGSGAFPRLATLLLVLLQTQLIAGDLLSPIFPPIVGNVCENVECGKGKCKPLTNATIPPYECDCDDGWKQTRPDPMDGVTFLNFLPCIVPNCSMDLSCNKPAEAPAQDKIGRSNTTLFDRKNLLQTYFCETTKLFTWLACKDFCVWFVAACNWADCGGGSCNKTSLFTYTCLCSEGYNNLLNTSLFPCYQECAVGTDCKDLGITMQSPPAPTPALSQNDGAKNQGSRIGRGMMLNWAVVLMASVAVVVQWR
ncbi:unnamed protein product [Linum tenue]|uniref:Uncharacterized protein n=1 Tax=Linum tenue TaxID=586396 RepID=A0AAV0P4A8_9ROSI|nr:unnamed protein product [Linum tenue]